MAEIKDKVITAESLKALHDYNKETYMGIDAGVLSAIITIPSGRMLGDVNGDGKVDEEDANLVLKDAFFPENGYINENDRQYADIDKDGNITAEDATNLNAGSYNREVILGKEYWVLNSNYGNLDYATNEMHVYMDIPIDGMIEGDFVVITIINENYDKDFFYIESFNGSLRLYAKAPPLSEITAIVQYGRNVGNATNITAINFLCNDAKKMANLFADGATVLSSYQYGDKLPEAGTKGRIFFKRLIEE